MKTFKTVCATLACLFMLIFFVCIVILKLDMDMLHRTVFNLMETSKYYLLIISISFAALFLIASIALKKISGDIEDDIDAYPFEIDEKENIVFQREKYRNAHSLKSNKTAINAKTYKKRTSKSKNPGRPLIDDNFSFDNSINVVDAAYSDSTADPSQGNPLHCVYCGARISKNSVFCEKCGKKI